MIASVTNADAIPVLERLMQFAGERHRLIANNIANFSTPDYRPVDLSVEGFQAQLSEAIDDRRERHGNGGGDLRLPETGQVGTERDRLRVQPEPIHDNILFHDRNDRDLERSMQGLVENFLTFRASAQFLRSRFELINSAIAERIA